MRRSNRVTNQAAREVKDDPNASLKAAEAPSSRIKAPKPVEASPKTAEVLAQNDSDDEVEHVSGDDVAEEYAEGVSDEELELDAFGEVTRAAVDALQEAVAEPAAFLRPSTNISQLARHAAKALYATAVEDASTSSKSDNSLPELYTDSLDAEQIWLQLDMQLGGVLKRAKRLMRKAGDIEQFINPDMEVALKDLLEGGSEEGASGSEDDGGLPDGEEEDTLEAAGEDDIRDEDEDLDEDERVDEEGEEEFNQRGLKPTEDRFMRLDDMERFVKAAEQREMEDDDDEDDEELPGGNSDDETGGAQARRGRMQQQDVDSEDEAALDDLLNEAQRQSGSRGEKRMKFQDDDGEDEDDSGEAEDIHYKDFFDPAQQAPDAADLIEASDEEDEEADEEAEEEGEEAAQEGFLGEASVPLSAAQEERDLSAHERRMQRMAERARKLEEQNVGDKEWFMRGEADSGARPLNSALEVDLDFERAVRPPPQPTEEVTASIEDLIKKRIVDHNFDDVPRIALPMPEKRRKTFELSDQKSGKGLGEIYEEEFVQATAAATGTALDDKEEKIRAEARSLTKELFAKLDALSHFQYAPKPVVEDLSVKADVPALAMEEVAPQIVSEAAMRLPEEVYRADRKGAPKGEDELTHEERRRRRAQHKRAFKGKSQQQASEKAARAVTKGGDAALPGRKSMAADVAAADAAKAQKRSQKKARKSGVSADAGDDRRKKSKFSSSSAFFGQLQEERDMAAKGGIIKPTKAAVGPSSKALKL